MMELLLDHWYHILPGIGLLVAMLFTRNKEPVRDHEMAEDQSMKDQNQ